jgi:four helix bundle protein
MEPENENVISFFRFEDLRIYHKSLEYVNWVHQVTKSFPENDTGSFGTNFVNASADIALNIAEGSSRGRNQFILHLKQSKTAIRECVVFTSLAKMLNYFDDDVEEESREHLQEMTKMIGALIGSLQRVNGKRNGNGNGNGYGNSHDSDHMRDSDDDMDQ